MSLVAGIATADDRDLLRLSASGSADPYVFIIFDTSASMSLAPTCTQADTFDDIDPFDGMCTQECPYDDITCSRICPSQVPALELDADGRGCREYAIVDADDPLAGLEGTEIVIDVDDLSLPTGVSTSGAWVAVAAFPPYKGDGFLIDNNTGETSDNDKTVTYNPTISTDGTYMIYMSWANSSIAATNTLIDIEHADGTTTIAVDQSFTVESGASSQFDGWNLLGTFELDSADTDSGNVTIRNESGDFFVVADAVRWVPVSVPPCLDPTDLIYRCQQPICSEGDCFLPLNGDDPGSKFFQAKQALYEALDAVDNVHFGFGSYEQDNARLHAKHWFYRVREKVPPADVVDQTLPMLGSTPLLVVGDDEVFGNYSTLADAAPTGSTYDSGTRTWTLAGDGWSCYTNFPGPSLPEFDSSLNDQKVGCESDNPVDVTDEWEALRGHRIPKLGFEAGVTTDIWYRVDYDDAQLYKVSYSPAASTPDFGDDPFAVEVQVTSCPSGTCGTADPAVTVYYDLVSDYAALDGPTFRHPLQDGGLFYIQSNVHSLDGINDYGPDNSTCFGLEPNSDEDADVDGDYEADTVDTRDDMWYGYSIKWPTTTDPRGDDLNLDGTPDGADRKDVFDVGDRVPLDWLTDNVDEIKRRLAPNFISGATPDFRIATYFENELETFDSSNPGTDPGESDRRRLRLKDDSSDGDTGDDERPLIPRGATPLGESLADFKVWYAGDESASDPDSPQAKGWADVATVLDADFPCRQKFVLLLTDGVDTCYQECLDPTDSPPCSGASFDNDPCDVPGDLLDQEQIRTYVVGFGVEGGSSLDCIAENGGTEEPLLPRNKEELVEALESILTDVQAETRTFASASIPAVQSTAADKIFLSSFTPLPDEGFWPGELDAYRAPLPLNSANEPDEDRACSTAQQAACHLWDAGQVLCDQVEDDDRTILYGMEHTAGLQIPGAARPGTLRELEVPQYLADNPTDHYDVSQPDLPLVEDLADQWIDPLIWFLYQIGLFVDNEFIYNQLTAIADPVTGYKDLPVDFVGLVDTCDTDGDNMADAFVLGDIFHASPIAISGPSNFTYFAADQCGPVQRTDIPNNCVSPSDPMIDVGEDRGYRRFAADHVWRRRMLVAPTNDGQVHVFDTGIRQLVDNDFTTNPTDTLELFNDGSGKELFSYIPRMVMPILEEQVDGDRHVYSMDGTVTVADVFIDPGDDIGGSATALDRAWRTVLVGGLREAGDVFPSADSVDGFKSGYFALDLTQPDPVVARPSPGTGLLPEDPTLVPCKVAGCEEDTPPDDEFPPSCMTLDAQGIVSETSDCPYRIDPSPTDTPQFPAELWTFKDSWLIEDPSDPGEYLEFYLDEDPSGENGQGVPDLAATWSRPVITQVAVCEGTTNCVFGAVSPAVPDGSDVTTRHVAIFGGGMDPTSKDLGDPSNIGGAYLYMVDVETGFPIYKRKLCPEIDPMTGACTTDAEGSTPADPTVLDTNRDGIADVVYIGTTEGYLYKIQLSGPGDTVPSLVGMGDPGFDITNSQLVYDPDGDGTYTTWATEGGVSASASAEPTLCGTVSPCAPRIVDSAWNPFPILDTDGSPIYFAASAFLVPERNQFALAVGTGDREDLWSGPSEGGVEGRFFVILDEGFTEADVNDIGACVDKLPITADCLVSFPFTADPIPEEINLLTDAIEDNSDLEDEDEIEPDGIDTISELMRPGWAMRFSTTDSLQNRITSEVFAVSGILVFSVFDPNIVAVGGGDDDDDDDDDDAADCGRTGTTRAFVVLAGNGAPLVNLSALGDTGKDTGDDDDDDGGGGGDDDDDDDLTARDRYQEIAEFTTSPQIIRRQTPNLPQGAGGKTIQDLINDQAQSSFRKAVLDHLPRGSRFNEAFELVIVALRNSTGVNIYASIPIAMYPADWADQ